MNKLYKRLNLFILGVLGTVVVPPSAVAEPPASTQPTPVAPTTRPPEGFQHSTTSDLTRLRESVNQPISQINQTVNQPISQINKTTNDINDRLSNLRSTASSSLGQITNRLGNVISAGQEQITSYLDELKRYFQTTVSENMRKTFPGAATMPGAMGLNDPRLTQTAIYNETHSLTSSQIQNTPARVNAANREIVQGVTNSVLGTQGQTRLSQQQQAMTAAHSQSASKADQSAAAATEVLEKASGAQGQNITQDVLKTVAAQNAQISQQQAMNAFIASQTNKELSNLSSQTTELQIQVAATNLQLTSIDSGIESIHSNQKAEQDSQYTLLQKSYARVYIPGLKSTGTNGAAGAEP